MYRYSTCWDMGDSLVTNMFTAHDMCTMYMHDNYYDNVMYISIEVYIILYTYMNIHMYIHCIL